MKLNGVLKRTIIFVILMILATQIVPAQEITDRIEFEHFSLDEGLEQSTVYFILQDSRGFLWIGTGAGLSRYDGYSFVNYAPDSENPDSISHHSAICAVEDSQGNLYIGTLLGGLNKYDRKTAKFSTVGGSGSEYPLSSDSVWGLYLQNDRFLWIATRGAGIDLLDLATGKISNFRRPVESQTAEANNIWSIRGNNEGTIWAASGSGLIRFNKNIEDYKIYSSRDFGLPSGSDVQCNDIVPDRNGDIYIGTNGRGIYKYISNQDVIVKQNIIDDELLFPDNVNIQNLMVDSRGWIWVATIKNGCYLYDPSQKRLRQFLPQNNINNSINENKILSFLEDRFGVIWIGTLGGGLNKYSPFKNKFKKYVMSEHGQENTYIRSVIEDPLFPGRILYAGTDGGGLSRIDNLGKITKVFRHNELDKNSIADNRTRTLLFDKSFNLWVATGNGVSRFNRRTETFSSIRHNPEDPESISGNDIWSLCLDDEDNLWIGTEGKGLNKYNLETGKNIRYLPEADVENSVPHLNIWYLFKDSKSRIWVGTGGGGLAVYNRDTDDFKTYKKVNNRDDSLSSNEIMSIAEDEAGYLWIATSDGVNHLHPESGIINRITRKDGLIDATAYAAIPDGLGNIWITSNHGLTKYNQATGNTTQYDISDGLQSNEFNGGAFSRTSSGRILLGGIQGINSFHPGNIVENNIPPEVYITELTLFNEEIKTGQKRSGRTIVAEEISEIEELVLLPEEYMFSLEFTALQFNSPEGIIYEYMLEGLHEDWIRTSSDRRSVSFVKLPPKEYLFRVRASSSDGIWSKKEAQLRIRILPVFWETTWFRVLSGFAIFLLGFSFYFIRTRRIKERNARLNQINIKLEQEIDERKRVEGELRKTSGELENRLEEIEILNTDLKAFDYSVSNALRVPLRHIHGYAGIIKECLANEDKETIYKYLDRLQVSVKSSRDLIDGLLQLSRATSEDLKRESIGLETLIRSVISQISREYDTKGFEFSISADISVSGDINLLSLAFYNILENAVKYSQDSAIKKIEIGLMPDGAIFIKDYGPGFEQQRLKKLFVPFHSYHTDSNFQGLGLGLAISKRIINRHGGIIWASSSIGEGSTFFVSL